MILKINCKYVEEYARCKNLNVERSVFGMGPRMCMMHNDKDCKYQEKVPKGAAPPPPMKRRS